MKPFFSRVERCLCTVASDVSFSEVAISLETRRIAVFIEETDQVVQNLFLPLRQRHPYPLFRLASQSVGESKAKVNSTKGQCTFQCAQAPRPYKLSRPQVRFQTSFMAIDSQKAAQ